MTINGFSAYSSKYLSSCKSTANVRELAGRRVAVDVYLIVFQAKARALKEAVNTKTIMGQYEEMQKQIQQVTKRVFYDRILNYHNWGWKLIFCFDSLQSHPLRENVKSRRAEDKEKLTDKIAEARRQLELSSSDPIYFQAAIDTLIKYEQQNTSENIFSLINHFRSTLTALGFPVFTPEDLFEPGTNYTPDGEAVASALVVKGYADIAYTTDADVLSYGCPVTITEIKGDMYTYRCLEPVLNQTGVEFNNFVAACILAGVDFNENVKGIAFGKALSIIYQAQPQLIDLLACQLLQLLTFFYNSTLNNDDNNGDYLNQIINLDWLKNNTALSDDELCQLETRYEFSFAHESMMDVGSALQELLPSYINNVKLWNLINNPNINWFAVLPLYRCIDYAVVNKSVDFDPEMFARQANLVLDSECLNSYIPKFCKTMGVDNLVALTAALSIATSSSGSGHGSNHEVEF